jgi:sulfatase modifying factor 1
MDQNQLNNLQNAAQGSHNLETNRMVEETAAATDQLLQSERQQKALEEQRLEAEQAKRQVEERKRRLRRQGIAGLLLLILCGVEMVLILDMATAKRTEGDWIAAAERAATELNLAAAERAKKEWIAAAKRAEREWIAEAERAESEQRVERECIGAAERAEKREAVAAGKVLLDKDGHALWRVLGGQFEVEYRGLYNKPAHSVVHVSTFFMGETKVTYGEWRSVMLWAKAKGYHLLLEGRGASDLHPVTHIQWHEAVKWCNAKSEMEGLLPCYKVDGKVYRGRVEEVNWEIIDPRGFYGTNQYGDVGLNLVRYPEVNCDWNANGYRLPTEAEWENAARGGLSGKSQFQNRVTQEPRDAKFQGSGRVELVRHGKNGRGLDDMGVNQWEWCWDWYAEGYSGGDDDPKGPLTGSDRVLRGNGWGSVRRYERRGYHPGSSPCDFGFRLARVRPQSGEKGSEEEWLRREKEQNEKALSRWAEKERHLKAQIAVYKASPEYAEELRKAREMELRKAREKEDARVASRLLEKKSEREREEAEEALRRAAREQALHEGVRDSLGRRYTSIPRGEFQMGSSLEADAPVKRVFVERFVMGQSEITYGEWTDTLTWSKDHGYAIQSPGKGTGASHPVTMVSWFDVVAWSNAKSEREGLTPCYYTGENPEKRLVYRKPEISGDAPTLDKEATGYRLPTEAEWEKAARGGLVDQVYPNGNTLTKKHANFLNEGGGTHAVMSHEPNNYGLFDMAGNVWEWCWDLYRDQGGARGVRGGGWELNAVSCRVAFVAAMPPETKTNDRGFRLVRRVP